MEIELLATGLGIITTLIGIGWKFGLYLSDIRLSVAKIETLLIHQSARIDRLELEVDEIKKELRWDTK
jgi:hypothetical protein